MNLVESGMTTDTHPPTHSHMQYARLYLCVSSRCHSLLSFKYVAAG